MRGSMLKSMSSGPSAGGGCAVGAVGDGEKVGVLGCVGAMVGGAMVGGAMVGGAMVAVAAGGVPDAEGFIGP